MSATPEQELRNLKTILEYENEEMGGVRALVYLKYLFGEPLSEYEQQVYLKEALMLIEGLDIP